MSTAVSHISPYAGSWFPGDPAELRDLLERLFDQSLARTGRSLIPDPLAFVVPHAGLVYSGTVSAAAYRHIEAARPDRILLLGFPHRGAPRGAWIPGIESFQTGLGEIHVDREVVEQLLGSAAFRTQAEPLLCDHSVEIQLPLLQRAAPGASLIPIYVSGLDPPAREAAARELARYVRPGTVLVASSDFTHYGRSFSYQPFPADEWVAGRLHDLDETVMQAAGSLDEDLFFEVLKTTGSTLCGRDPIALLLATLRRIDSDDEIFQETLDYQTSGEITGDFHHSVSYAALGYFRHSSFHLDEDAQVQLLESARNTLRHYQETGERKPVPPGRDLPVLDRRAAAFVTLHRGEELRGCVGRRSTGDPLSETVPALALSAALDDARFDPVSRHETGLEVEISVLTPLKRIRDLSRFRVNRHGAYLEARHGHALLLPQVATERDWTSAQFFNALARKAGVPFGAYHEPDTRVFVFRAQILR